MGSGQQALIAASVGEAPPAPPSTNLQLWLDASAITGHVADQEIDTWEDLSGNNRDATGVVNNTLKPIYRPTDGPSSLPAVRMLTAAGVGGYFTLPDFTTGFTAGHGFAVVKLDNDPPGLNARAAPPLADWGTIISGEFYNFPSDSGIYDGFGTSVRKTTGNPDANLAAWHLYEVRTETNLWSRRINAATSGNDFFSTVTNTVAFSTYPKIGGRVIPSTSVLSGLVAEIIFYDAVLGSTDYDALKAYITDKYGLTLA